MGSLSHKFRNLRKEVQYFSFIQIFYVLNDYVLI